MNSFFDPENNFIVNILRKRYDVEISDKPDYLFFTQDSTDFINFNGVRIFYTPENLVPDFNLCDYGISFQDIMFGDRYIRYPVYLVETYQAYKGDDYASDLRLAFHKHEKPLENEKEDFCAFVYSNSHAVKCRDSIFDALSKYKHVNSGGRYRNNIGGGIDNKLDFQKKHKFVIAFENTSTPGYTTEKIVHAFAACSVPIYWGNPDIIKEFNPCSFINCHDYGLTEEGLSDAVDKIVEKVKEIDEDKSAYLKMLQSPAFNLENDIDMQQERFERFLFNIFDQDYNQAFRRNRFYWGERYERRQRIGNSFYVICRKMITFRDFLHKVGKRLKFFLPILFVIYIRRA